MKKNFYKVKNKPESQSQRGMTVIEMLVAICIFMLIMFGSIYLLRQIYNRYGFAMEQGMSVNQVHHSLKIMIDDIRGTRQADSGGYPVDSADKFSFTFYTDTDKDGATERVHYYLQGNSIMKGVTKPNGTPAIYPSGDQTTTTYAEHVVNTAGQPLFYFYNTNYPADQVNNPLATPVTSVENIRLVKVDVYYNLNPYRSPDNIRLESYVEMRNLKDNW